MLDLKTLECLGKSLWYVVFRLFKFLFYTCLTKPLEKLAIKKCRESWEQKVAGETAVTCTRRKVCFSTKFLDTRAQIFS